MRTVVNLSGAVMLGNSQPRSHCINLTFMTPAYTDGTVYIPAQSVCFSVNHKELEDIVETLDALKEASL